MHQGQGISSPEIHSYAMKKQEECGFEIVVIELGKWMTDWWSKE